VVDATPFLPGPSPVQGKAVIARFDGFWMTSAAPLQPAPTAPTINAARAGTWPQGEPAPRLVLGNGRKGA
jgi:hypothetical protein